MRNSRWAETWSERMRQPNDMRTHWKYVQSQWISYAATPGNQSQYLQKIGEKKPIQQIQQLNVTKSTMYWAYAGYIEFVCWL